MSPAAQSPPVTRAAFVGKSAPTPGTGTVPFPYPDALNTPYIISTGPPAVMAYFPDGVNMATVTLSALPAPGSTFGVDKNTLAPNNGAFYDPRGFVTINVNNTLISGYNFTAGVGIGPVSASGLVVQQCWGNDMDGDNNWLVWTHNTGTYTGLVIQDCLVNGTSTSVTGPNGILYQSGAVSDVVVQRCHTFNCGSGNVHLDPVLDSGTQPYQNIIRGCFFDAVSDPSGIGEHLENISFQAGTGGVLVQGNHFTGPAGQTATIFTQHFDGDIGNITLDNNLLDGFPQNTIYAGDNGPAPFVLISTPGNFQITNNKFANTGGQNPGNYVIEPAVGDPRLAVSGNVHWPSLAAIPGM